MTEGNAEGEWRISFLAGNSLPENGILPFDTDAGWVIGGRG